MIRQYIKWIMVIAGVLTCSLIFTFIAPQSAMQSMFGETLVGPTAEIVVRNWAVLITLVGVMLIYGAFVQPVRNFVLVIATIHKCIFIALVITYGPGLSGQIWGAIATDSVMVAFFLLYFFLPKSSS